ncbi:nuclease-related domain-containing protein [Frankia sp. QA3]|uniref:nuclease-related domain-containing protein n=1 Tax=Frankia sp. QA3 TaxID=710111 RepID=UPI000269CF21|nr:nuclease-related domain-containing protein [Frankia sp. QA3]EIV96286.1 nuclease-like protein [Frankia sp. QA3]
MSELQVTPWRRYGHDRLYVNLPDGQSAAWFDLKTRQLNVLLDVYQEAVLDALAPYLAERPAPPSRPLPPTAPPPVSTPAPPAAPPAGWTPAVPAPSASWPVSPPVPPAAGPMAAVPHPADDLAGNAPGAAIRAKIKELTPGFWRALLNRLLRRPSETEGWRKGLVGEETVGAELERLTGRGWRVLHSVPLPRDVDIDHLLIGPGGVFTFNTKYHVGARIWVGDQAVKMGRQPYPYVRKARAEAGRATRVLTQACGFTVTVDAVLAFVEPAKLTVEQSLHDVRAIRHDQIAAFGNLPVVWQPGDVERIYAAARDRRSWLNA